MYHNKWNVISRAILFYIFIAMFYIYTIFKKIWLHFYLIITWCDLSLDLTDVDHKYCAQQNICLFFKDLGSSDLRKDVYVVAHIFRIGKSCWMHTTVVAVWPVITPSRVLEPHINPQHGSKHSVHFKNVILQVSPRLWQHYEGWMTGHLKSIVTTMASLSVNVTCVSV